MISFRFEGTRSTQRSFTNLANKSIDRALVKTVNGFMDKLKQIEMKKVVAEIDRPRPFTSRLGFAVYKAHTRRKPLKAGMFIKDIQARYMKYPIKGGVVMTERSNTLASPNVGLAKLDEHGNIPGKKLGYKVMAKKQARLMGLKVYTPGTSRRRRRTPERGGSRNLATQKSLFVGKPRGRRNRAFGVWQRTVHDKLICVIASLPNRYRARRFMYFDHAETLARSQLRLMLRRELKAEAIRVIRKSRTS
jgi:hypothetical protein